MAQYSQGLAQKPQVLVLNKLDLPGADEKAEIFQSALDNIVDQDVFLISATNRTGITRLISKLLDVLDRTNEMRP